MITLKNFKVAILALMLMTVIVTTAFAAAEPTITVSSAALSAGQTETDITISISDNPGIVAMQLKVDYSEYLTLTNVTNGSVLNGATHDTSTLKRPYYLTWGDDLATADNTSNGIIVTLTFSVSDDAPAGNLPITVSYNNDDAAIYNVDMEIVDFAVVNGFVTVPSDERAISGEMLGAQPRTEGVAGLRFGTKFNVNDDFLTSLTGGNTYDTLGTVFADGISDVSFGTLVIPLFVLEDNSLTAKDLTHALCGDMDVADVICKNIFGYDNGSFTYTAVVTNIPEKYSGGKIVARGYVKYTENGKTVYHYLDQVTASPDEVKALAEGAWYKD